MSTARWFDPDQFSEQVAARKLVAPKSRVALGLDLGTNCGVAIGLVSPGRPFLLEGRPLYLGQWDLSAAAYDSGSIRFLKLRHLLTAVNPDFIFFENVVYTPPQAAFGLKSIGAVLARAMPAAEFIGALKGTLCCWAEEAGVPCAGLPIGAIKRRATGRGNANKSEIITACNAELGTSMDAETYATTGVDNIADAAFCLLLGLEQFGA